MAHRGRRRGAPGRHGGDVPVGLPHRDPYCGHRAVAAGAAHRLELRVCGHGGVDGDRRRGRARRAARTAAPRHASLLPRELPVRPAAEALEWIGRLSLLLGGAYVFGVGFTGQFVMIEWAAAAVGIAPDLLAGANALGSAAARRLGPGRTGMPRAVPDRRRGAALPGARTRPSTYFVRSYGDPLRDFFSRFAGAAGLILAMICCYRLSDFVLNIMNPFYLDLGFDLDTIAEVRKGIGVVMLMLGVGAGGWSIARFGLMRSLIIGALRSGLEPGVRLARDAGPGSARLRARGHGGQRVRRLCRDHSHRLYVQSHQRGVHGDPVRAVLLAVFASRQADRGTVGHDRRGERADGGARWAIRRIDRPVLRPAGGFVRRRRRRPRRFQRRWLQAIRSSSSAWSGSPPWSSRSSSPAGR